MSLPSYAVTFRGLPACPCQATWLPGFEAEAQRRGIIRGPLPLSQLIGGAAASGGTHTKGGADDTYPLTAVEDIAAYVALSRQMGADATWFRPYNWDNRGGVAHVHRVLTGCPHASPAAYQIAAVRDGFNGLGYLGHAGPDTGPRPLSGRTWKEGLAWARKQREKDDLMAFSDWPQAEKDAFGAFIQDQIRAAVIPNVPQADGTKADKHLAVLLKGMAQNVIDIEKKLGN